MAFNEYDQLAGTKPVGNEYDALAAEPSQMQAQAVQQSFAAAAVGPDPDRQAKILALSQKTGLDTGVISRNFDMVTKESAFKDNDYESIVKSNPGLAKWLQDPDNSTLAKDEVGDLQAIENTTKEYGLMNGMYNSLQSGIANVYSSIAKVPALAYDAYFLPANLIRMQKGEPLISASEDLRENAVVKRYDKAGQDFAAKVPELDQSITTEIGKGNFAAAGRIAAMQVVANAPQQAALLLSMATGFGESGLVMAGVTTAAQANTENARKGINPIVSVGDALAKGTIESAFESIGTFGILKHWEGTLANSFGKETAREVIGQATKAMAYSFAGEANEEFLTSIAQDMTDYISGVNPDALKGMTTRALDAGAIGGASGLSMTGPAAILGGAIKGKAMRDATMARDFYNSLGDSVEATKLRERSPERTQLLINHITEGGPVENIYISPEAFETYFQSKDKHAAAVAQELGIQKEYNAAKESGADIQIKVADFAAKVVGTEHWKGLQNDIKFNPSELSVNEVKAEGARLQEEEAQSVEAAKAHEISIQTIEQNVVEQLMSTGMKQQDARTQAMLYGAAFKSFSEKSGISPQALFERYGLKIETKDGVIKAPQFPDMPEQKMAAQLSQVGADGKLILDQDNLSVLRARIEDSSAGARGAKVDENGDSNGTFSQGSTFPEFFKDKGLTKLGVLSIIDKHNAGEKLTENQTQILRDLYDGMVDKINSNEYFQNSDTTLFQDSVKFNEAANNLIDASGLFKQKKIDDKQDKKNAKEDARTPLDDFKSRYPESKKEITKNQNAKLAPYVSNNSIKGAGFIPNFKSEPTGVIGEPRIQQSHEKGSNPDPLSWYDTKFSITKQLIEKHSTAGIPLEINTSSDLVAREDYVSAMPKGTTVNMYMLTSNEEINRAIFPGNPSLRRQQAAVDKLRESGIKVNVVYPTVDQVIEQAGGLKEIDKRTGYGLNEIDKILRKAVIPDSSVYHIEKSPETGLFHVSSDFTSGDESFFSDGMSEESANNLLKEKQNQAANQRRAGFKVLNQGPADMLLKNSEALKEKGFSFHVSENPYFNESGDEIDGPKIGEVGSQFTVYAEDKTGNEIGRASFKIDEQGNLVPDDNDGGHEAVTVDASFRRMGIATELYRQAAEATDKPVSNKNWQTESGKKFREALRTIDQETFMQGGGNDPRGQIRFGANRQFNIDLFKSKDESTFLHETGHFLLEVMGDLAQSVDAAQSLKDDHAAVLKWLGVESQDQIGVEQHEQFARGFEAYLMEGKAPSSALRKAFNIFKVWLTNIYKQAKALNVELSDEIRGVFDRVLVAESEVTEAERAMNYAPMLHDPKAMGMSDEQVYQYLDAVTAAREYSESLIRAKLMEDVKKKQTTEYKATQSRVTKEITDEANASKLYNALAVLQTGKMADGSDIKGTQAFLSRESVEAVYGKEFAKELPRGIFSKENGLHFDIAAQMLGYHSGEEMIQDIQYSVPKKQFIENQVNAEMLKLYPEGLTSPDIRKESIYQVHNDQRAKMLRLEAEWLMKHEPAVVKNVIRKVARRMPTEQHVRVQATQIIGAKNINEIYGFSNTGPNGERSRTPGLIQVYQRAEVKFAKEAGVHLSNSDYDKAFESKRKELLNHELYRAANQAKSDVEKNIKNWKRLFRSDEDIAKNRDMDIVNAARAVLAEFGITKSEKTAEQYLGTLKSYDPDTYGAVMALVNIATENGTKSYKQMNYDEFVNMSNTVNAMWDLAKSSREIVIEGETMQKTDIIDQLNARTAELAGDKELPGYNKAVTDEEKRGIGLLGMVSMYRKAEHWAYAFDKGVLNGAATKYLVRPIINAQTEYNLKKIELHKNLEEIAKLITGVDSKLKIEAPEIQYTFKNKQELLHAVLHSGNDSNLYKLLVGRGWGVANEDKSLDRSRWDKMVNRMQKDGTLTKADYDFAQAIWNQNEKLKPGAQKAHKKMYGYYFNEVTANPVETAFGEYRGGYVPAIVDSFMNIDQGLREDKEALEKFNNSFTFPTTGSGFTKSRVENYTAPLQLDLNRITSHMEKVLRFTHLEPTVKDVAKIVTNRDFAKNMSVVDPTVLNEMMVPWLQRVATQAVVAQVDGKGGAAFNKAAQYIRSSASLQLMALNVANWFQNTTGAFQALTRVDGKFMAGAMKDYVSGPNNMSEQIMEKSEYMKSRIGETAKDVSRQYHEVVLQPTQYENVKEAAKNFAFFGERVSNGIIEMLVWHGAYDQHLSQGNSDSEAVKFADATTRQTLTDMSPTGSSRVESGTHFQRLFTMLTGFFFNSGNLMLSEMQIAKEMGLRSQAGGKRAAQAYIMIVMAPAIISALINRGFAGQGLDANDDREYLDDIFDIFFMSQFKFMTAMIPGGTIANTLFNTFNNKPYDDKINVSPAVSGIEKSLHAPKDLYDLAVGKGNPSKALSSSLTAIGMASGLPTGALARPLGYLADVNSGKAKPTGPIDFTRGVVTGKDGGKTK